MVGSNMLLQTYKRLQQIKGTVDDSIFANTSILAVGDLYQLPPVRQHALYQSVSDPYAALYTAMDLYGKNIFC